MTRQRIEYLKLRSEIFFRFFSRRKSFWLRGFLCWLIGCFALSNDEITSYDQRFQIRGNQSVAQEIILIQISQSDFNQIYNQRKNALMNLSEITDITDSFYWNKTIWTSLLSKILSQKPKSIGVTLYFGENIGHESLNDNENKILHDRRVFWSTSTNYLEKLMTPAFGLRDQSNLGSNEIHRDEDGVVRRLSPQKSELPHLVEKIVRRPFPAKSISMLINFRGSTQSFNQYTLTEILNDELPIDTFKNKIVLIGAETTSLQKYLTPIGVMSRTEVMAHMTDTLIGDRWIKRFHFSLYALVYIFITALAIFIITRYPQSVALILFLWMGTLIAALSAWVFDSFYIWFPALSPIILLISIWIIFIGYQANKIERQNFRLQQEQKYFQELEQLKNNFVSLISHDLKTPIAKIQAIVDRLMTQHKNTELEKDLQSLGSAGEELNRYIQSILKLLRVESRDFRLHREVADINEIIEEALIQLKPLAMEKHIAVQLQLEPMFSAEFDVTLIKEVIINLIENAIKYTPENGLIEITSEEIENEIRVKIRDTGQGIAPEDIEQVWKKFVRGKDQDLRTKGSGLGLYLVKYFIELHGGQVQLESSLGKGSTVSFTLPLSDDTSVLANEEIT